MSHPIPKAMELAKAKLSEVARVENLNEDQCLDCQQPYSITEANGLVVKACVKCRVVMPTRDNI